MSDLLFHVAALEMTARDLLAPVCGLGVAWCVIGAQAIVALAGMAGVAAVCWLFVRR